MVIAMERACAEETDNVRFISMDALKLREVFAPDEVERIFVNFCDPWPKSRDAKHRLTSPNFCGYMPISCQWAVRYASRRIICRCLPGRLSR